MFLMIKIMDKCMAINSSNVSVGYRQWVGNSGGLVISVGYV